MSNIHDIIEHADLVLLAERAGAQLRKRGNGGARGACPLHGGDNTSAFSIYSNGDGSQHWHCFTGCDAGGDAVDFVQQWRGLNNDAEGFKEAVRIIAAEMNLPEPEFSARAAQQSQEERAAQLRKTNLLNVAAEYYHGQFLAHAAAQDYAAKRWDRNTFMPPAQRDMDKHTRPQLGYSDGQLLAHLLKLKADLALAQELGLVYAGRDGALRDAIPPGYLVYIHRYYNKTTYFTGRSISTNDKAKKSRNLHTPKTLYWALRRKQTPLMIVEGQACAMTAWEWHYNAVALCGSALQEHDVTAIQSYPGAYLLLDQDVAYKKIHAVADQIGPLLMIVRNLPAQDLNEWHAIGGSSDDLSALLPTAKPWIELEIERATHVAPYDLEDALDDLARLVGSLPKTTRGKYIGVICDRKKLSTRKDFRALLETYTQDDLHSAFEIIDGRMTAYGDALANCAITITHELIRDDGINPPSVEFTMAGSLDTGEPLETITMPAEEFDGMKWIPRHWGARPIIYTSPGKSYVLKRAVQELSRFDLKRERVHTHTGWSQIDGQWRYLTTEGGLGAEDLDTNIRVDVGQSNLNRYALPTPPADLKAAIKSSLDFLELASYNVTVPLLLGMYAAPLSPFATLDAVLWVYGTTQSGKSTLSHLALSHFGKTFIEGRKYHAPREWFSTVTDMEYALFVSKDIPLIIDDYAPAHGGASEARQLWRTAHRIIRTVGNRSAKGRSTSNLRERAQRPPRSLVISTAENPIIGQSAVGRTIYVPIEAGEVFKDHGGDVNPLDAAQRDGQNGLYSQAMAGYVAWIAGQFERLQERMPVTIAERNRAGRTLFVDGQSRLTDYYGLLSVTGDMLLDYAQYYGAISASKASDLLQIIDGAIFHILSEQAQRTASESPVNKLFQALGDLCTLRKCYFIPKNAPDSLPPLPNSTLTGWYDDKRVYLLTNIALAEAKSYWRELDDHFDIRADAIQRQIWQQGYVAERGKDNHIARVTYINKIAGRKRTLNLDGQRLAEAGLNIGKFTIGEDDEQTN